MTPEALAKLMGQAKDRKAAMKKTEKTAKLAPGENLVRLLPGWRGEEDPTWYHDYGQHYVKDAANQVQAVYLCTNQTFEKPCEVCAALAKASSAAGDDATTELLSEAKSSRSILINALMLNSTEPNTPVVLEIKRGLYEQLLDIVIEYEGKPLDPNDGMIIRINRDGKGLNTKYSAIPTPKTSKVAPATLAKIVNLDEYVKQESESELRRAIGAINNVAGILPAPSGAMTGGSLGPKDRPSLPGPSSSSDFQDIPDFDEVGAAAVTSDDDINAILSDLPD